MPPPQLFVSITSPPAAQPVPGRTFQVRGNISWLFVPTNWGLTTKSVSVQFGPGTTFTPAAFPAANLNWECAGTVNPSTPWGSLVSITVNATASFRFPLPGGREHDVEMLSVSTTLMVRLPPAIAPTIVISPFTSPIVAPQLPVNFAFTGSATSPQAPIQLVQYKVEGGQFFNAVNVSGNWSQWRVTLPLPPTAPDQDHTLTIRAVDTFGTANEISQAFKVQALPPIVIPPGGKTTLSGAPTTSSITSWTRLEPQCNGADIATSANARVFDPLWMLTRQWQMGEFQAEDAGTPIQACVRATSAMIARRYSGELPTSTGPPPAAVSAAAYDPTRTPLDVLVERRRVRAADPGDARALTLAVESGLHFLRMVELQAPSKSYRAALITKLALQPLAPAAAARADEGTSSYLQSMVGRAPDGRQLALLLRTTGAAPLVADATLNIAAVDRPRVHTAATAWLAWYDAICSEPAAASEDAWNPARLEYAVSVGTRLSANATDDITLSASEVDGPIDWASFDVNTHASLTTAADQTFTSLVEAVIPAPVTFPGLPLPRFWEMEDARLGYGLVPVGPTDLAHLMMIEYASSYGNDWFVVPLTLPVGSITRVDSLVVTDTFGVRSLVRPLGDPALPPSYFSMWQPAYAKPPIGAPAVKIATNRFFLPPTVGRSIDSAPLEDVLLMRDEMANLAWAIERTIESPIGQPTPRYEAVDAAPATPAPTRPLPRYLLASEVPPNWIPLLPVQVANPLQPNQPGQILTRLRRGAVLQPNGTTKVQMAAGEVLRGIGDVLLFDEEVPREGARITRQRRLARWADGSTWLWMSLRNEVGRGEGSSGLKFDQVLEPETTAP